MTASISSSESLVNTYTAGIQEWPAVALLDDGGWIIVWLSHLQDGSGHGIYAQRYAADGSPVGAEFRVNTHTPSDQIYPGVAALGDGGWVVTWMSLGQDGSEYGVYQQRYTSAGAATGGEVRVNTTTANGQWLFPGASVAPLEDGGWVVTWYSPATSGGSPAVYTQRYAASGAPVGGETLVASTLPLDVTSPTVAGLPDGGWLVSWATLAPDGDVFFRRYDAAGTALGGATQVNGALPPAQRNPSIAVLADGGWLITWMSEGQDGSGWGVYAHRYSATGVGSGEFRVNTTTAGHQQEPHVTALADGGWIVAWISAGQDGSGDGIFAQRYNAAGNPVGGEVQVNQTSTDFQVHPAIAALPGGGWLAAWTSLNQDGSSWGIYARQMSDGPVNTVGGPAVGNEDTSIALTGISVSDNHSNPATDELTVHLSVAHGTLTIRTDVAGGITAVDITGGGNGANGVTLTATQNQINATLAAGNGLVYQGDADFHGTDGLTVSTFNGIASDPPTFAPVATSGALVNPSYLVNADVSGDGVLDLVYAGSTAPFVDTNRVGIRLGNGDGTFDPTVSYVSGGRPSQVIPLDLDDDGDLDLLVSNYGSGVGAADGVVVLHNDGVGNFGAPLLIASLPQAYDLLVDDFNGDGRPDLAVAQDTPGTVSVMLASGPAGSFAAPVTYTANSVFQRTVGLVAGDFNGDGRPDLVAMNFDNSDTSSGEVSILINNGDGTFGAPVHIAVGQRQPFDGAAGDLNGDGNLDLVYATHGAALPRGLHVLLGNGDGTFQPGIFHATTSFPIGVSIGDVNGDGRPDLVSGTANGGMVAVFVGNGDGSFRPRVDFFAATSFAERVTLGDFDGDGDSDIALNRAHVDGQGVFINTIASRGDVDTKAIVVNDVSDVMPDPISTTPTLVNTNTIGDEMNAKIVQLADGGWIVVWMGRETVASSAGDFGVFAQRYDASGAPVGGEFQVNSPNAGHSEYFADVAALPDGGFVFTWNAVPSPFTGAGDTLVYTRRYDAAGFPGAEVQVNAPDGYPHGMVPVIAVLADGGWVVVLQSARAGGAGVDLYAYRYDSSGSPIGGSFMLNSTPAGDQNSAAIAALADGGWIATWESFGQDSSGYGIYARRFDALGNPVGGETLVNSTVAGPQQNASVTGLADGGWIVAWMSTGVDGSGFGVVTQRYNASGAPVGGETLLTGGPAAGDQGYPTVVAMPDGGFVLRWLSQDVGMFAPTGGRQMGVYVQRFDAAGAAVGSATRIGTSSEDDSFAAAVAPTPTGWIAAFAPFGPDGSGYGIYALTSSPLSPPVNVINGTEGDDFIVGTPGDDQINGLGGNDLILGAGGNDQLYGGNGDDTLEGMSGVDTFDGGAGFDRVSLHEEEATQAVIADLRTQIISNDGYGNSETMTSIEALGGGTRFADTFYGDDSRNLLVGSTADTLYGFGGDDSFVVDGAPALLDGGNGQDGVDGFRQRRLVDANGDGIGEEEFTANGVHVDLSINQIVDDGFGGSGTILGIENLGGSAGDDVLIGDGNDNLLDGGDGNDLLEGRVGNDTLIGGGGIDTASYVQASGGVEVDLRFGAATGADGDDGLSGIENVVGSEFDDVLFGDNNANIVTGLGGADFLFGFGGGDTLDGGDGDDVLRGDGQAGYIGPSGNDTLTGGAGNDFMNGGAGVDSFDGGDGFDRISFFNFAATQGAIASLLSQTISNDGYGNAETMTGVEGLGGGTAYADQFTGDDNANDIFGGPGDTLIAHGGDDFLLLSGAPALVDGGIGIDTAEFNADTGGTLVPDVTGDGRAELVFATSGIVVDLRFSAIHDDGFGNSGTIQNVENITGSELDDQIFGDGNANVLSGRGGADTLFGFGGSDTLDGGDGDDFMRGEGNFLYNGPGGNDVFFGGDGNDYMNGAQGVDSYDGGSGFDRISFYNAAATQGAIASLITQTIDNDGFGNAETMVSVEGLGGGTAFADHFTGDDNANEILGDAGDTLIGNGGDDNFFVTGATLIDGGDGEDTAEFFSRERLVPDTNGDGLAETVTTTFGVNINLRFNAIVDDGFGNSGTIVNVENVGGSELDDILFGSNNANVLNGHGGADFLVGFGGDDTVDGGEGDDVVFGDGGALYNGPSGNDVLRGGGGDDLLRGGAGIDSHDGGDGFDRISFFNHAATQAAIASLITQTISNDGYGNAETMTGIEGLGGGTAFADQFTGDDNDNDIFGGIGDTLLANGGDDYLLLLGAPALVNGGAGVDTAEFAGDTVGTLVPDVTGDGLAELVFATSGINVDLRFNAIIADGFGNSGTIQNVENIVGSELDDTIRGNNSTNVLTGNGGFDQLLGFGGDDTLNGGAGNDVLRGDGPPPYNGPSGNDVLNGGDGDDFMNGGAGVDSFDGGDGFDRISFFNHAATQAAIASLLTQTISNDGYGNAETMTGVEGLGGGTAFADHFTGDDNANDIFGGPGDTLLANGGDDFLLLTGAPALADGGDGVDTAEFVADTVGTLVPDSDGDGLAEQVFATSGVDVDLRFNAINDDGFGNSGTIQNVENVTGSELDDSIIGDGNANALTGRGGNDFLFGVGGDDTIDGGEGHDFIRGMDGNDSLHGGAGNDLIRGGIGDDLIDGGDGFDRVSFFLGGGETIPAHGVTVSLLLQGVAQNTGHGWDILVGVEALSGTPFDDHLTGDHGVNAFLVVGGGNDQVYGLGGDDLIEMGVGNHVADGGAGIDSFSLRGNTTDIDADGVTLSLLLQGAAQDTEQGMMTLSGFENLSGSLHDDNLTGDGGANVLAGDEGSDSLAGGAGDDTLLGDGMIRADVPAGAGTAGPPAIFDEVTEIVGSGHGDDLLEGGLGNDTLIGGGGSDTASYANAGGAVDLNLGAGLADEYAADGTYLTTDTLNGIENADGSQFDDALVGDVNANLLRGLGGNDLILGGGGDDTLEGGDGHDHLQGQQGNDSVHGGAGNDLLRGQDGDDLIDGGDGFDRFSDFAGATTGVTVSLLIAGPQDTGHGMDTFVGIEALSGTPFDDHLTGDHGVNWFLVVGGGTDTVSGEGGDDLIEVGAGNHLLDGGGGVDTASFRGNTTGIDANGVTVSLQLQGAAQATEQGMMSLAGFENLSGSIHDDSLTGDGGANLLAGDEGSDTLSGGGGDDTLLGDGQVRADTPPGAGTAGPPAIFNEATDIVGSGHGDDLLEGGMGNDTLIGGGGSDTAIYANAGGAVDVHLGVGVADEYAADGTYLTTDTLSGIENATGSQFDDALVGDANANLLRGLGGNDLILGGGGGDTLEGGDGHDHLQGQQGNDSVHGGAGNDLLRGQDGDDLIDGGDGFDRFSDFAGATTGVTVSLLISGPQDTGHGMDTFVGIEALSGTPFDDYLTGDHGVNWFLVVGGGNDTVSGEGGDDLVEVGTGNHNLTGGLGIDTASFRGNTTGIDADGVTVSLLLQGTAQDTEQGMMTLSGFENLSGSIHGDSLTGDGGSNLLAGDEGADTLVGGDGDDILLGDGVARADTPAGAGTAGPPAIFNETTEIVGDGLGDDLLEGGAGNDTLIGGGGIDTASWEHAAGAVDLDLGAGFADEYDAVGTTYLSSDSLSGIENAIGSAFDDALLGSADDNLLRGLAGNDFLFGLAGDDTIEGGDGHDFLRGYDGNDLLLGGDGHDLLRGGNGDDTIDGGAGFDRASFFSSPGEAPPATGVTVSLLLQGVAQNTGHGMDILVGIEALNGTPFDDNLTGDNSANWLLLTGGSDTASALDGDDLVSLGDGNHVADGGLGLDTAAFAPGFATGPVTVSLVLQGAAQATGIGSMTLSGFENLSGTGFGDTLTGDAGANLLAGDAGNDTLDGGDGADTLYGDGAVAPDFAPGTGTAGPIAVFEDLGVAGNDVLNGGDGTDILNGGGGDDVLTGGKDDDRFEFGDASGHDRITDFDKAEVIAIDAAGVDDLSDLTITQVGKDTLVSWDGGAASVLVENYKASKLTAANFELGGASAAFVPLAFDQSVDPPRWPDFAPDLG